jgi:uncharacterized membrane protein
MELSDKGSGHDSGDLAFQEKLLIVSLFVTIIIYTIYAVVVFGRYGAGDTDIGAALIFWSRAVLLLIAVQVVFRVITAILVTILNTIVTQEEEDPSFADERDQQIERKGTIVTFTVFSIGFLSGMAALAVGRPPGLAFGLIMVFMMAADVIGDLSKLIYYRRGF